MCNKKSYQKKWQAQMALRVILKSASKHPWRDEISVYQCMECDNYHISSKMGLEGAYMLKKIKEQSYFDTQKDKWGDWLQNYSSKGAVINKNNKKYST